MLTFDIATGVKMSWIRWACLGLMVSGLVFFLYGANFYNAAFGWSGVALFVVGLSVLLAHYVYGLLTKEADAEPSPEMST